MFAYVFQIDCMKNSYISYRGDTVDYSAPFSQVKKLYRAIRSPLFIHARTRQWCRVDMTTVYHRDPTSPSGKIAVAGGHDPLVSKILQRCKQTSPLSPTEMLGA